MKTAVAIKHVHFEDLGSFEAVLASRGHEIQYTQAGRDDIAALKSRRSDLLSVLGGPIGAYPEDTYPFLKHELQLIETRLTARRPVIRICFGAQLIARALGARAFPAQRKELG